MDPPQGVLYWRIAAYIKDKMAYCLLWIIPSNNRSVRDLRKSSFPISTIENLLSTWAMPGKTDAIIPTKRFRDSKRPFKIDQPASNDTLSLHEERAACRSGLEAIDRARYWCSCFITPRQVALHPVTTNRSRWFRTTEQNSECKSAVIWWGTTYGRDSSLLFDAFYSATMESTPEEYET